MKWTPLQIYLPSIIAQCHYNIIDSAIYAVHYITEAYFFY